MFTAGEDYVEGPYSVTIPKGQRSVELCINIIDDEELEEDKDFAIEFNTSALHPDVVVMDPQKTKITIVDNECKHKDCTCQFCICISFSI